MKRFLLCCTVCILILALTGCGDVPQTQGEDSDALRIGVKNTEEHQVLGILAKILIEEKTDAKAKIVYDDDVTSETLFDDLQNKKLEMYFDYSGSVGENVLSLNHDNGGDEEGSTMLLVELQNILAGEYQTYLSNSIGYEGGSYYLYHP